MSSGGCCGPRGETVMAGLVLAAGRPMVHDLRAMLDAVFYVARSDGAISVTGGSASLTVQGGRFAGNHAANGGAIYNDTGLRNLSVTGATFIQNTATGAGGAIYTGPLGRTYASAA